MAQVRIACLLLLGFTISLPDVQSFQANVPWRRSSNRSTRCSAEADFAYQELRAQVDALKRDRIAPRDLSPVKRAEFENYAREVALKRSSSIPLAKIGDRLPGTTWRLAFSTEGATLGDLPRDAAVYLRFLSDRRVDYCLEFSQKTFGLNSIKAKSTWMFDKGLLTIVYDKITTDAFGLKDVGVGFFGLLQGRANYVESAYFDDLYWIEQALGPTGKEYINVYIKEV